MTVRDLMNTHEVADYLRIKERKVYDLVARRQIPCSRVTGKWVFPKTLIDLWLLQGVEGVGRDLPVAPPPVIAGSSDPLLEWAVRESRSDLAVLFDGSLDGLQRFTARRALACGLHVPDPDSGDFNAPLVKRTLPGVPYVLIEWARRQQGLIVRNDGGKAVRSLADLKKKGVRVVDRQREAGSRILFEQLLKGAGMTLAALNIVSPAARSESEVALAVADGRADVGFGIAAAARQFRLGFLPLAEERYDLLIGRRDYFEPPFQALLAFARGERLAARAAELGGYDLGGTGGVILNGP